MRLFDALRDNRSTRQREREVRRIVNERLAHVAEAVSTQVTYDLLQEDVGWTKSANANTAYDLSSNELALARARCIWLWQKDPVVAQRARLLQSGTFGKGLSVPRATEESLNPIIERFWTDEDNQLALFSHWSMCLCNLLLMLEGERFLTIHTSSTESVVKLADIVPGEISNIVTHPQYRRKPVLYERTFKQRGYEFATKTWRDIGDTVTWYYVDHRYARYVDDYPGAVVVDEDEEARELIEACPNLQRNVSLYHMRAEGVGLRGFPEVYRTYDWTRQHNTALCDLATIIKALAAFAWKKKINTKSADVLKAAAQMLNTPPPGPAAIQVENQNANLEAMNVNTGHTGNQQAAIREMFLQSIRDGGFGEHWYGNADTGNLATAAAMELPAIWRIDDRQELFGGAYRTLTDFAIDRALMMKDFPVGEGRVADDVDRTYDLDFPPAQPTTDAQMAQRITAIREAANDGYIPQREASYMILTAIGSNNINELMEKHYPEGEEGDELPEETQEVIGRVWDRMEAVLAEKQ